MGLFSFDGFDGVEEQMKELEQEPDRLRERSEVTFDALFSPAFMLRCTQFPDFADFLAAGGFSVESLADFEAIPDEVFDRHVAASTLFASWAEMFDAAMDEHLS
jgi:hypothetical protein